MDVIILDAGSGVTKCGYNTDNQATYVFPTVIGRPRYRKALHGVQGREFWIGNDAQRTGGILNFKYPIERGRVVNWDDMEKIWSYTFHDKLQVNTQEMAILLVEPPLNPMPLRERTVETMFETFNFNGVYLGNSSIMSLYSAGLTSGLVVESGHGVTHVVPIYEGSALSHLVARLELGGHDVTNQLAVLLAESGHNLTSTSADMRAVQTMKEQHAYVAIDLHHEFDLADNTDHCQRTFQLPDDQLITLNTERFECAEILFQPHLVGARKSGLTRILYSIAKRCDSEIAPTLVNAVVLSGGNTLLPGLEKRIRQSMRRRLPPSYKINLIAHPQRQYSAWMGAAIFARSSHFPKLLITPEEYHEHGSTIVHRKCLS